MFIEKEKIIVQVHPGIFHADDVLCVAMLFNKYGANNVTIIRDSGLHVEADYVLDVGNRESFTVKNETDSVELTLDELKEVDLNSISLIRVELDHHPVSVNARAYNANDKFQIHSINTMKDLYDNDTGIKHCAASKLFDLFNLDKSTIETERFKKVIIEPTAIMDNGQSLYEFGFTHSPLDYVKDYNCTWKEDISLTDSYFMIACKYVSEHIAEPIDCLEREYIRVGRNVNRNLIVNKARDEAIDEVRRLLKNRDASVPYLFIEDGPLPWKTAVIEYNQTTAEPVYFEIHEDKARNQFVLIAVPPDSEHLIDQLITIPETVLLEEGCIFRHSAGFMACFRTKQDAIRVANRLYSDYKNNGGKQQSMNLF